MLGKLIRYDSKIQMKFYSGVYMVMGVVALLAAILKALQRKFEYALVFQYGYQVTWLFCRGAAVVLVIGSVIYAVGFFRKNLFKDEGYFMHTLPVAAWQLFVSKLITCTIWIWISIGVAVLGCMLGSLHVSLSFWNVMQESGITEHSVFLYALPMLVLAIPAALSQFYVSLAIGYTWKVQGAPVDRDILSVVAVVITYTAQQIVSVIALFGYLLVRCGNVFSPYLTKRLEAMFNGLNQTDSAEALSSYVRGIFGIATVTMLVTGGVFCALSIWRMSRHLNME